ncbi:hypothetical protein ERJ75_000533300 [Trypanosoma vivax]|nr:hypothetical protein ERJ75_000533300 [Trypanosoma vivax]
MREAAPLSLATNAPGTLGRVPFSVASVRSAVCAHWRSGGAQSCLRCRSELRRNSRARSIRVLLLVISLFQWCTLGEDGRGERREFAVAEEQDSVPEAMRPRKRQPLRVTSDFWLSGCGVASAVHDTSHAEMTRGA